MKDKPSNTKTQTRPCKVQPLTYQELSHSLDKWLRLPPAAQQAVIDRINRLSDETRSDLRESQH
jgi:hypothetical protein